ncbi:MAG: hypothetical protein CL814_06465 [Confluentimicrobium sp.]|jgi:hypothetical protein|uniref:NIPSNAP family protein n=1 Tax=Actibacterium sp. TaxID=1872125 RepID=UPI000C53B4C6|nr:NIPSNAP family protein [Actibacterium sp.]MBC56563.1 hypothetical protein [Actibacterium sp.]|tara:strand:- start:2887 stop:3579 length:693 start_codon:yes stop_codon:yes gene_type:complete
MSTDIYELRIYTIAVGRTQDMADRFRNDLSVLFPRHGVRIVGSWTAFSGPQIPTFVYLMRWVSLEERDAAFAGFVQDPDWQEARDRTNAGSELVEHFDIRFMRALTEPQIAAPMDLSAGGIYELTLQPSANGRTADMQEDFISHDLATRARCGGTLNAVFLAMTGPRLPLMVSLMHWPDAQTHAAALSRVDADPALTARRQDQTRSLGRPILDQSQTYLMHPLDINWTGA